VIELAITIAAVLAGQLGEALDLLADDLAGNDDGLSA
jgi:hypothetical protein